MHGKGKFTYKDGSTYEGEWEDDKRDDKHGHYIWKEEHGYSEYKGEFKDDKRHGHGTYTWLDQPGYTYKGDWKDGMRHGKGHQKYPNGSHYDGEYVKDQR